MNPIYRPISFCDVDEFSAWEKSLGWEIDSTQITGGDNEIAFDHIAFPDLLVGQFKCRRAMYNSFLLPEGAVIFVIPRAKLPMIWCGREVAPNATGVARSTREHWATVAAGWDCYEFMVSEDLIRRTELFPPAFFDNTTDVDRACVPLVEPMTSQFIRRMDGVFNWIGRANGSSRSQYGIELYDFIIESLQRIVDAGLAARGASPRPLRRADLVPRARELVVENLQAPLTAEEVAESLGVSYRVLHYAIRDAFGIGPYRYFLTERLHAVRRLLKASNASVAEARLIHDFTTSSRFARQYKRLFGELPSETMQRSSRASS